MELKRRHKFAAGLLTAAWLLVVGWQVQEHLRVVEAAKSDLRSRSHEIAGTLSAVTRALRFRGAVFQERLEPVLNELVHNRANTLVKLIYVGLLNTDGDPVVAVGDTNLFTHENISESEHWSDNNVTFVLPIEGASVSPEGVTNNSTVVLPSFRDLTNGAPRNRDFFRRDRLPGETNAVDFAATNFPPPTNFAGETGSSAPPPDGGERPRSGNHRPPWMRGMSDADFKALAAKRELHGLVLVMSTGNYRALCTHDLWLRGVIAFFAGISALGASLAWRNFAPHFGTANPPRARERTQFAPQGNELRRRRPRARDAQSAQPHSRPGADDRTFARRRA